MFPRAQFHFLTENKPLKSWGGGWGRERERVNWFLCSCFVKLSLEINSQGKTIVGQPAALQEPSLFLQVGGSGHAADGDTGKLARPSLAPDPRLMLAEGG